MKPIRNVVLYVSDALRWDHLPEELRQDGRAYKTVAAGCATMESMTSLLTGLYPPEHGVRSWYDELRYETLLDWGGGDTGFYNAAGTDDGLNVTLGIEEQTALSDLGEPFLYVERDHGGHAPYAGAGYDMTQPEMVRSIGGDDEAFTRRYREAIKASIKRFRERLLTLERMSVRDQTLVVFTSDHGEQLGEFGFVSHSFPPTPELVYVPTVLFNPNLGNGVADNLIGHTDITDLMAGVLDAPVPSGSAPHLAEGSTCRPNFASATLRTGGRRLVEYSASGAWTPDGGHVFKNIGRILGPLFGFKNANSWGGRYWSSNPRKAVTAVKHLTDGHRVYGKPGIDAETAREIVDAVITNQVTRKEHRLEEDVEDRLNELGYL